MAEADRENNFQRYMVSVADTRYVMRTVSRIVDDCAKLKGLDPLEHQALIQIAGAREKSLPINTLAMKLDIVPGLASRIVKQLKEHDYVGSSKLPADKRVSLISVTESGLELLRTIDEEVHFAMAKFQRDLSEDQRYSSLRIFGFYVGLQDEPLLLETVRNNDPQKSRR